MLFETTFHESLHFIITAIDFVGVAIVLWGTIVASIAFIHLKLQWQGPESFIVGSAGIRASLGTYILLGLEFMIASDIINTFARPTAQDVLTLAVVVAIRTAISYFLRKEIDSLRQEK